MMGSWDELDVIRMNCKTDKQLGIQSVICLSFKINQFNQQISSGMQPNLVSFSAATCQSINRLYDKETMANKDIF